MKTLIKLFLVLVFLVILIIAGLVVFGLRAIDNVAKEGIERGSTYAFGVETTVDSVDLAIFKGEFSMQGYTVSNPEGFSAPHFLSMDSTGFDIDMGTLNQETIEIPVFALAGIDVNLQRSGGSSNYKAIIDNLKRLTGDDSAQPEGEPQTDTPADPASDQQEKYLVVRDLTIDGIMVHVDMLPLGGLAGDSTKLDVPIETINLKNIGTGPEGGVSVSELVRIITQAVLTAVTEKAGDILPAEMLTDLQGQLADLGSLSDLGIEQVSVLSGEAQQALEGVTEGLQDAGEKAKEALDDAKEGLEGAADGLKGLVPGGG